MAVNSEIGNRCAFLELPAELRNIIYEYIALTEHELGLLKNAKSHKGYRLTASSTFIITNRQIYEEYSYIIQDVALQSDITISARVTNLDFTLLQTLISSGAVKDTVYDKQPQIINVQLIITHIDDVNADNARSWLEFCSSKVKALPQFYYFVDKTKGGHKFPGLPPSLQTSRLTPITGSTIYCVTNDADSIQGECIEKALAKWIEDLWMERDVAGFHTSSEPPRGGCRRCDGGSGNYHFRSMLN